MAGVIPYRIIMTRTNPLITTKIEAGIYKALADADISPHEDSAP